MVQANTQAIQNEIEDFTPDEKIYFAVGNASYNNVYKVQFSKTGAEVAQCMADIPHAGQDCRDLSSLLEMYDFDFRDAPVTVDGEVKPKNRYMTIDGTRQEIIASWNSV